MPASNYKREDVIVTIATANGTFIVEGYAEGEFFTAEMDGDGHTVTNGSHGYNTANRVDIRSGMITLNLHGSSPANALLQQQWNQRRSDGSSFFGITMKDVRSGGDLTVARNAFVLKEPNMVKGEELQDKEWPIKCMDLDIQHGGSIVVL